MYNMQHAYKNRLSLIMWSDCLPPATPPIFENNEQVLVYHRKLLYEAKVLKTEYRKQNKKYVYFVHYVGWKKSWDEWALETRVLKYNRPNLEKQKDLKLVHEESQRSAGRALGSKPPLPTRKKSTIGRDTASVVSATDARSSTLNLEQTGPKLKKDSRVSLDSLPPATPPIFENNERVLCFHGPFLYEGKVLNTEYRKQNKEYAYFIHYASFNKSWDEWALEIRVLKYNEPNLENQKDLKEAHDEAQRSAKRTLGSKLPWPTRRKSIGSDTASVVSATDSRSSTPNPEQTGPKLKKDSRGEIIVDGEVPVRIKSECVEPESLFSVKQEVEIKLPEQVKVFLFDDWDAIVRQRRLVRLPARHSVEQILEDYLQTREKSDMSAVELCNGIREYFNCMIGAQLIYGFEREQYEDILRKQTYLEANIRMVRKQMTEIYGVAHLMRLFTKLGGCLSYTSLDVEGVSILRKSIEEFFKFLLEDYDEYFSLDDYGVSEVEYQAEVPA